MRVWFWFVQKKELNLINFFLKFFSGLFWLFLVSFFNYYWFFQSQVLALELGYVASLTSSVFQGSLFTPSRQAQWHIWMGDSGRMGKAGCLMPQVTHWSFLWVYFWHILTYRKKYWFMEIWGLKHVCCSRGWSMCLQDMWDFQKYSNPLKSLPKLG